MKKKCCENCWERAALGECGDSDCLCHQEKSRQVNDGSSNPEKPGSASSSIAQESKDWERELHLLLDAEDAYLKTEVVRPTLFTFVRTQKQLSYEAGYDEASIENSVNYDTGFKAGRTEALRAVRVFLKKEAFDNDDEYWIHKETFDDFLSGLQEQMK